MKQLEVQILGQSYLLGCPEDGDARLLEAVERVDTMMSKIRESGKVRARERIAVLTALNFAFDLADLKAATYAPLPQDKALETGALSDPRLSALLVRLDAALNDDLSLI